MHAHERATDDPVGPDRQRKQPGKRGHVRCRPGHPGPVRIAGSSWLPVYGLKGVPKVGPDAGDRAFDRRSGPSDQHIIPSGSPVAGKHLPGHLSQPPLCPVPGDRVADPARAGQAEPDCRLRVNFAASASLQVQAGCRATPGAGCLQEVFPAPECRNVSRGAAPVTFGHAFVFAPVGWPTRRKSGTQGLASPDPAPIENLPARPGSHSCTETMAALAYLVAWLECALHVRSLHDLDCGSSTVRCPIGTEAYTGMESPSSNPCAAAINLWSSNPQSNVRNMAMGITDVSIFIAWPTRKGDTDHAGKGAQCDEAAGRCRQFGAETGSQAGRPRRLPGGCTESEAHPGA